MILFHTGISKNRTEFLEVLNFEERVGQSTIVTHDIEQNLKSIFFNVVTGHCVWGQLKERSSQSSVGSIQLGVDLTFVSLTHYHHSQLRSLSPTMSTPLPLTQFN